MIHRRNAFGRREKYTALGLQAFPIQVGGLFTVPPGQVHSMDLGNIAESAVGTFTGAAIALASMWMKELFARRKAAQVWYEQYYIAEGIDRLLSYVRMIDVQMATLIPT